jgi:MbtH protein
LNNVNADERHYFVVVNDEQQYSIWPIYKELPTGWYREGTTGTMDGCLARISAIWNDMRPQSLRLRMAAEPTVTN